MADTDIPFPQVGDGIGQQVLQVFHQFAFLSDGRIVAAGGMTFRYPGGCTTVDGRGTLQLAEHPHIIDDRSRLLAGILAVTRGVVSLVRFLLGAVLAIPRQSVTPREALDSVIIVRSSGLSPLREIHGRCWCMKRTQNGWSQVLPFIHSPDDTQSLPDKRAYGLMTL